MNPAINCFKMSKNETWSMKSCPVFPFFLCRRRPVACVVCLVGHALFMNLPRSPPPPSAEKQNWTNGHSSLSRPTIRPTRRWYVTRLTARKCQATTWAGFDTTQRSRCFPQNFDFFEENILNVQCFRRYGKVHFCTLYYGKDVRLHRKRK